MSKPESIGEIISKRKIAGPKARRLRLELINMNWSFIAGERLAERSIPTKLTRGTLTVAAESASWATELSIASGDLLRRTGRILGEGVVRKVNVRSRGYVPPESDKVEPGSQSCEMAGVEVNLGGELTEEISCLDDVEMREALTRLLRASRSGRRPGKSRR